MKSFRALARQITLVLFFILYAVFYCVKASHASPVNLRYISVGGVPAHVVTVDTNIPSLLPEVQVSVGFPFVAENFSSFLRRSKPVVAVTGTYFCKRTLKPVGDIVINGQQVNFGGMGTAMCITPSNTIVFEDVEWGRHADYSKCKTVLAAGPRLVRDGKIWVYPKEQGFSDPHVLGDANRLAVGLTKKNKLIIAVVRHSISLEKTAKMMKQLGCVHAMALDSGGSMALYANGKVYASPSRKLVNILVIPSKPFKGKPAKVSMVSPPEKKENIMEIAQETEKTNAGQNLDADKTNEPLTADEKKKAVIIPPVSSESPPLPAALSAFQQGETLMKKGETEKAIEAFKDAVYFSPENASYAKALGEAYEKIKSSVEASAAYTMAGKVYFNSEMYGDAIDLLQKSVALFPKNIEAHKILASAYSVTDKATEAAQHLKMAEELSVESVTLALLTDVQDDLEMIKEDKTKPPKITEFISGFSIEALLKKEVENHEKETDRKRKIETTLSKRYPARLSGDFVENLYMENTFKFSFLLPEGWAYEEIHDSLSIKMRDMDNPFFGNVQVIPLQSDIPLKEFEEHFMAGMFKKKVVSRERTISGKPAYEVLYDEMINDRAWGSRYIYVKYNSALYILTLTTYAERYEDASPSFRQIIENFKFFN